MRFLVLKTLIGFGTIAVPVCQATAGLRYDTILWFESEWIFNPDPVLRTDYAESY